MAVIVIGFTGLNASGKTTAVDVLKKEGFYTFSLSDAIRDELEKVGLEKSRDNMFAKGNELRKMHGPGVLGKLIAEKISLASKGMFAIDSIRNPKEIEELRKLKGFMLVGVDANSRTRYERAMIRGRNENASTYEDFMKAEERELSGDSDSQQLSKCYELADIFISNDSTLVRFEDSVKNLLKISSD